MGGTYSSVTLMHRCQECLEMWVSIWSWTQTWAMASSSIPRYVPTRSASLWSPKTHAGWTFTALLALGVPETVRTIAATHIIRETHIRYWHEKAQIPSNKAQKPSKFIHEVRSQKYFSWVQMEGNTRGRWGHGHVFSWSGCCPMGVFSMSS